LRRPCLCVVLACFRCCSRPTACIRTAYLLRHISVLCTSLLLCLSSPTCGSFSRLRRWLRRPSAPPPTTGIFLLSLLGKFLFLCFRYSTLVSCKICRPFSSSTSCSLPTSSPRLRAAHCCLLSVCSFPFWFVALATGAQQGPLLGDVAMLREGDCFGACVCGLRRRRTSGAPPKFRRVAAGGPRPRRAPLCDAWYAEADEMRRRTYILLCSSDIFSFFSCVGSIHLLCALVFVHVRLPILDSTVLECLPELSCCACATILFLFVSLRLFFVSVDTLYEGFLFFSFTCVVYM